MNPAESNSAGPKPNMVIRKTVRVQATQGLAPIHGMGQIIFALYLAEFLTCRQVYRNWGIALPLRLMSEIGNSIVFLLFVWGTMQYLKSQEQRPPWRKSHATKVKIWILATIGFAIFGFVHGNVWNRVGIELMSLSYMGMVLMLGVDDRVWRALSKHITVIFWIGVVMISLFYTVPMLDLATGQVVAVNSRFTVSVGGLMRPLIGPGLLLGMWGWLRHDGGGWRIPQILAPFGFVAVESGIFLFRSQFALFLLSVACFVMLRPIFERKLRIGRTLIVLLLVVAGGWYFIGTESASDLVERAQNRDDDSTIYRVLELSTCMQQMGSEVLIGRGLGGVFDASRIQAQFGAKEWGTLHFGIFVYILKGGVLLFSLFLMFVFSTISARKKEWYRNPQNLAAALLVPVLLIQVVTVPFYFGPEGLILYMPMMMIISRFGRDESLDVPTVQVKRFRLKPRVVRAS